MYSFLFITFDGDALFPDKFRIKIGPAWPFDGPKSHPHSIEFISVSHFRDSRKSGLGNSASPRGTNIIFRTFGFKDREAAFAVIGIPAPNHIFFNNHTQGEDHMKNRFGILVLALMAGTLSLTSCRPDLNDPVSSNSPGTATAAATAPALSVSAANINGAGGDMPAYYDTTLFTINFKPFSEKAAASLIAHNRSINTIYTSPDNAPSSERFIAVLDAIQGDGFNPLWREVHIVFNGGFTPHQFFSDNDILAAASGPNPEITLDITNEIYRCSVVGKK